MWAHYAREAAGFVIEIDEDLLLEEFPESRLEDMNYCETPTTIDVNRVAYAYGTGKPRHTYFLQQASFNATYFTKSSYWSYEFERRFVVNQDQVSNNDGLMIMKIPMNCVTGIITGPRTNLTLEGQIRKAFEKHNNNHYRMRIGRSSMRSFFLNNKKRSFIFNGQQITKVKKACTCCREPLDSNTKGKCPWCAITEAHKHEAARRNPMRLLASYGLLEGYMKSMADIGKS